MLKTAIACALAALLGFNSIPPPKQVKTVRFEPIHPTSLATWVDTCAARYNVPKEVIYKVGINESGWGKSPLAKQSNNLFGIKCGDGWTGERAGKYRKYPSRYESVEDFCKYMVKYYSFHIGKPYKLWKLRGYAENVYHF